VASIKNKFVPDEPDDSTDHLDLSKARRVSFPNLKPSTESISLRLPLLHEIKPKPNQDDAGGAVYQITQVGWEVYRACCAGISPADEWPGSCS